MRSKEELRALKEEIESVSKKLAELSEDELAAVTGGVMPIIFASEPGAAPEGGDTAELWNEASAGIITDTENKTR